MIRFENGQITDILPASMARDIQTQCVSYALQKQIQNILYRANRTRTVAAIDLLPETVLDVLATELRTPYYREDMDIETKRDIIKKTLLWHTKAGTPSAVAELIEVVFGDGKVVEWFDYDEGPFTPGTFDIVTSARMTEDIVEYFMQIVRRVKNTRSHIRRILINREMCMHEYMGSGILTSPKIPVTNNYEGALDSTMEETVGAGAISSPGKTITNSPQGRTASAGMSERASIGATAAPHEIIRNSAEPVRAEADGHTRTASAVASSTVIRIYNGAMETAASITAPPKYAAGVMASSNTKIN